MTLGGVTGPGKHGNNDQDQCGINNSYADTGLSTPYKQDKGAVQDVDK